MIIYSFSKARQRLAALLDQAAGDGEVRIRRKDGREFAVKPVRAAKSPLDVKGVDLGVSTREIVQCVRESRAAWRTKRK